MEPPFGELLDFVPGVDLRIDEAPVNVQFHFRDRNKAQTSWTWLARMSRFEYRTDSQTKLDELRETLRARKEPDEVI